jgi:hypothetical protein
LLIFFLIAREGGGGGRRRVFGLIRWCRCTPLRPTCVIVCARSQHSLFLCFAFFSLHLHLAAAAIGARVGIVVHSAAAGQMPHRTSADAESH